MGKFLFLLIVAAAVVESCDKKAKTAAIISPHAAKAEAFYGTQNDSAFYYFNKVVQESKDSGQLASAYYYMGWIQSDAGDYFGSQESLVSSLQFLNKVEDSNHYQLSLDYNMLGTNSLKLSQLNEALTYYDLAIQFYPANRIYYLNNKALAYQKKEEYNQAVNMYQMVIDTKIDSIAEYARVLSNLAKSKWLRDSTYQAAPELHMALAIRKAKEDKWGLNASYAHLADYYARSRKDSALFYSRQMYNIATSLNSADDEIEALDKLIRLERPTIAANYFNRYSYLNDSIQQARNSAKNQFALIRFDSEKSKSDNLLLQQDNLKKKTSINLQRFILIIVLFIFASLFVIARLWYKKRKQRFQLESQNAVKEQQLKTSKKIHDVVANGLYQVMTEIEHKNIGKEKLLDRIELLYEKSRDISYEASLSEKLNYDEEINNLLSSFSEASVKVLIVGNNDNFWAGIPISTKKELEYILQELMVNMKKHSQAQNVLVKFDYVNDRYYLKYNDDGIGMGQDVIRGNGLRNTGNRIHMIGGTINFESSVGKGLKVDISFPKITNDN